VIKILCSEIGGKNPEKGGRIFFLKLGTYSNSYGITSCESLVWTFSTDRTSQISSESIFFMRISDQV
jgi:hypothetical protein